MGCFLGCFGLSSNRKRRKPTRKILPGDQRICSYEPLNSLGSTDLDVAENPENISNSNFRCESEEKTEAKVKKRVRFNLNVQAYEPIPSTYEDKSVDGDGEEEERNKKISVSDKKSSKDLGTKSLYPSNYRYQNYTDNYDDEDETAYGERDLEDEDYYTDDDDKYEDDADDEEEEGEEDEEEMKFGGSNMNARDRSRYVSPVLNPVENLAQWKAVKVRALRVKQIKKENAGEFSHEQTNPLLQEITVETSLSNWLASSKNFNENASSKRSLSERSPILDITNMGNR